MATNIEPIYGLSEDEVSTVFAELYHLKHSACLPPYCSYWMFIVFNNLISVFSSDFSSVVTNHQDQFY